MVTIVVSGSGTGVGKTRVTSALARAAATQAHWRVQIVKPVQTGMVFTEASDAEIAAHLAGLPAESAYTLRRYPAALAPMAAAALAEQQLNIKEILAEIAALPETDLRLIEGAGGTAVPLKPNGWDWVEFADEVGAKAIVLVVTDELGAINQARLVMDYCQGKYREKPSCGIFLNAIRPPLPEVALSTRLALADCGIPIWGELPANATEARLHRPLAELLGIF